MKHFFSEGFRLVLLNDLYWRFEVPGIHCIAFIKLSELNPKLNKFCVLNWWISGFRLTLVEFSELIPILMEFSILGSMTLVSAELSPILMGFSRLGSITLWFSELRSKEFCILWLALPVLLVLAAGDCWLAFLARSFLNLT